MTEPAPTAKRPARTYGRIVWSQFRRNRLAVAGLCVVVLGFLLALAAPLLANNKPFVLHEGSREATEIVDGRPVTRVRDVTTYPLIRDFFMPSPEISERGLTLVFNFALAWGLLLLVAGWPLLRLTRALAPARRRRVRLLVAGALALLALVPFFAPLYTSMRPHMDKRNYREEVAAVAPGSGTWAVFPPHRWDPFEQKADEVELSPFARRPADAGGQVEGESRRSTFARHPMGTDRIGRDVLSRVIHGARVSLAVGLVAVAIYLAIGVMIGSLAGYFGGWVDIGVSRLIEIMMGFPTFLMILIIIAVFKAQSVVWVMVVIGVTGWTGVARLMRGEVLKQRRMDYVIAARALGAPARRVMFRHILPNAIAPVLVRATFGIAGAIFTESALAFLGLGVRPPTASWGELLKQSLGDPELYWWLTFFPGFIIFLMILSYNLAGEGLRDAIDPRLKK